MFFNKNNLKVMKCKTLSRLLRNIHFLKTFLAQHQWELNENRKFLTLVTGLFFFSLQILYAMKHAE